MQPGISPKPGFHGLEQPDLLGHLFGGLELGGYLVDQTAAAVGAANRQGARTVGVLLAVGTPVVAGGYQGGQQQPEQTLRNFLAAHLHDPGVHVDGHVPDGHQAGGLEGPGLPVRPGAGAVGVQLLTVPAGTVAHQVAANESEVVAQGLDKVCGVDHRDGILEINDIGHCRLDEQVPELPVAFVDLSSLVKLEEDAEPVVLKVELVEVSLRVKVEAEEF